MEWPGVSSSAGWLAELGRAPTSGAPAAEAAAGKPGGSATGPAPLGSTSASARVGGLGAAMAPTGGGSREWPGASSSAGWLAELGRAPTSWAPAAEAAAGKPGAQASKFIGSLTGVSRFVERGSATGPAPLGSMSASARVEGLGAAMASKGSGSKEWPDACSSEGWLAELGRAPTSWAPAAETGSWPSHLCTCLCL